MKNLVVINHRDLVRAQAALEILALDNQHSDVDAIRLRGGMRSLSAARLQRALDRLNSDNAGNVLIWFGNSLNKDD
tara:strand:- start:4063 stop:4290 length:228 start_codon:yes stop_codon:yes gene_type:complete